MDKLSEYIPLLIIIGSIIVSSIKGLGKAKQKEIEKTTLPGHRNQPEVKEIVKKSQIKMPDPVVIAAAPIFSESSILEKKPEAVEIPGEPFLDGNNTEEVKKAIIYAEIFNRRF